MRITPAILEATYTFLAATKPFSGWKLPHPDNVEFHVTRFRSHMGDTADFPKHVVRLSERKMSYTVKLVETMAHEMVHLYVGVDAQHGLAFRRAWKKVCLHHGFDPVDI